MYTQLCFETERFKPLTYERRYVKSLSPGKDVAIWLREHLRALGYTAGEPRLAGQVWVVEVGEGEDGYLIGIKAARGCLQRGAGCAEWRIVVEKKRTRLERMLLLNGLRNNDELCIQLRNLLKRQFDFLNVREQHSLLSP